MQVRSAKDLAEEGHSAYKKENYLAAAKAYEAAAKAYQSVGDAAAGAEMANNSSVAWLQGGEPQQALRIVTGTGEVFAEVGDPRRQGMAYGNQAAALEALNRLDEAMDLYQRAAVLLEQVGDGDARAYVLQSISKIQFRTGRQFEALASMQAGMDGINRPNLRQRFLKRLLRIPMRWLGSR